MNSTGEAFGQRPASAGWKTIRVGAGRRKARSAQQGRFPSAQPADARRAGWASNEFDLPRPCGRRPASAGRKTIRVGAGRRPAHRASGGRFQSAQPADTGAGGCRMNSTGRGLRPAAGLRRPEDDPRRRRPTPGAPRLWRPISIGATGRHGRGRVSNEFDRERPSASGRPPPAGRRSASAQADARRGAPNKADFNRRNRPTRDVGRRMNSTSRGLRPSAGLRRPEGNPRRRRPTPGAQRPTRPILIGATGRHATWGVG
ncbi:hypothetical protein HRbin22_00898 [Candidatus Thermoflexus japonica]|uniref:Uncharacterized protein n=1 Tax=Candidatus Thermoflexus japonica TaxID=2035417 RepID=A0A2H5Y5D4_9CHLR|nr:hypothetical protein HRbin22_00898 [Candidatus Thermoflexus japonica]